MKEKLAFIHGWGFDHTLWDDVIDRLPGNLRITCAELGFSGRPVNLLTAAEMKDAVIIGHSLGASHAITHGAKPKALIVINGFKNFNGCVDDGVLDLMQERIKTKPYIVLKQFYKNCGVSGYSAGDIHPGRLAEGLEWLSLWTGCQFKTLACPVTILASADDNIDPPAVSMKMWGHYPKFIMREDGGHVLPLTEPAWCARHIQEVIDGLHV